MEVPHMHEKDNVKDNVCFAKCNIFMEVLHMHELLVVYCIS